MATDEKCLPFFVEGEVVKGFGRGSKELGIPTANFPEAVVKGLPESMKCGVYYGWASVDSGPVFPMVMSVGWNPYYHNTVKTMETHILHNFKEDFYGNVLKVIMLGFIRPMEDFSSLEALIAAINQDIAMCKERLKDPAMDSFQHNNFFHPYADHAGASCSKL
ncbi:riboflavin kinase-like [Babylonia areolata]|uniref:riboflavin kinase-like n=1 Tax=Babylonia areolata TaxID=304850 RepID=UPI003FD55341